MCKSRLQGYNSGARVCSMTQAMFPKAACGGLKENGPHRLIHVAICKTGRAEPSKILDITYRDKGFTVFPVGFWCSIISSLHPNLSLLK